MFRLSIALGFQELIECVELVVCVAFADHLWETVILCKFQTLHHLGYSNQSLKYLL